MEFQLALVNADGEIAARGLAALVAHGEGTATLAKNTPGLGKAGDTVRVPSPLEHPTSSDDLAGHTLALVGTTPDGEQVVHPLNAGAPDTRFIGQLVDRIAALEAGSTATALRFSQLESRVADLARVQAHGA